MVWTTVFGARPKRPVRFMENLVAENAQLHELLDESSASTQRLQNRANVLASENEAAQRLQRLLLDEMHHRSKNSLAVIRAIATQTFKNAGSLEEARGALDSRLTALGRAQDILMRANWSSAKLADVTRTATESFEDPEHPRIELKIAAIDVSAAAVLPLILSLNELCTNAIKYGALSGPTGHVILSATRGEGSGVLILNWSERCGPAVMHPTRQSFGTKLLSTLALQMNGEAHLRYEPTGFEYELRASVALNPRQFSSSVIDPMQ